MCNILLCVRGRLHVGRGTFFVGGAEDDIWVSVGVGWGG